MTTEQPPTSQSRAVSGPLPCVRCEYNLDGQPLESVCPECGTSVGDSRESLWLEETDRIRGLRRGVRHAILAAFIGPTVFVCSAFAAILSVDVNEEGIILVTVLMLMTGPALAAFGMETIRRGRVHRSDAGSSCLAAARTLAIVFAVSYAIGMMIVGLVAGSNNRPPVSGLALAFTVAGVSWCARNILLLVYFRGLVRVANMRRQSHIALVMMFWAGIIGAGGCVIGAIIGGGLRFEPPGSRAAIVVIYFVSYGWFGLALLWLAAWPLFLSRVALGLRTIIRQHEKQGRPEIVGVVQGLAGQGADSPP